MSLLNFGYVCPDNCFFRLFYAQPLLNSTPYFDSKIQLYVHSCDRMFSYSTISSITSLPQKIYTSCFDGMFANCQNLKNVPINLLTAKQLYAYCYINMFLDCHNLKNTPRLPATILEHSCYWGMFHGTALTSTPILP